jgi:hypothetical protein
MSATTIARRKRRLTTRWRLVLTMLECDQFAQLRVGVGVGALGNAQTAREGMGNNRLLAGSMVSGVRARIAADPQNRWRVPARAKP